MFKDTDIKYIIENCLWEKEEEIESFIKDLKKTSDSLKKVHVELDLNNVNWAANLARTFFESFDEILMEDMDQVEGYDLFDHNAFKDYISSFVQVTTEIWLYLVMKEIEEDSISTNDLDILFEKTCVSYPVWAKQCIILINEWRQNCKEMIIAGVELKKHLSYFFDDLKDDALRIHHVSGSESDIHNHGRCVHIYTLNNNRKVVYKPRSMGIDRAVDQYIRFMCEKSNMPAIPSPKNIDISVGALCEFITYDPVQSQEELKEYFYNLGFITGCLYIIGGYDLHKENIIAHGKYPVIIDNETSVGFEHGVIVDEQMDNSISIMNMGLLPGVSDLVGMQIHPFAGMISDMNNLPEWNGKTYNGYDCSEDIVAGFDHACMTILEHKEEIKDFIVEKFTGQQTRILYRSTMDYYRMRKILETPKALKSAKDYEHFLHTIGYARHNAHNREEFRKAVLEMEYKQYRRLDIPAYSFYPEKTDFELILKHIDDFDPDQSLHTHNILAYTLRNRRQREQYVQCDDMCGIKDELIECIDGDVLAALYADGNYYLYSTLTPNLTGLPAIDMGIIVSLAAYLKCVPDDQQVKETVNGFIEQIENMDRRFMAESSFYFGLDSGTSGFLFGLYLLEKMGYISKETFYQRVHKSIGYMPCKARMEALDLSLDRGLNGMRWFRSLLDMDSLTQQEREKIEEINEICKDKAFDLPKINIESIYKAYMNMPHPYVPVDLFYGFPAILYTLCQRQKPDCIPDLYELLK